jgi:thioredoxin 1
MCSFNELLQQQKPVLADFYADWCGPCKAMQPLLIELKAAMGSALTVVKINVDKQPGLAARYQVHSLPTLLLFKAGKLVWQQAGVIPLRQLQEVISRYR